ncbi:MAG: nucleotidyltransferase [Blastocatellales bacterium]
MTKAVQEKYRQVQPPPIQRTPLTLFANHQGEIYREVISETRKRNLPFAIGGGFAINAYTGLQRNTKDLDIYVMPSDCEAMKEILTDVGMSDYSERLPYDPKWIYRGYYNGVIVDVIWAMANQVTSVDERWLTRGPIIEIENHRLRLLPPEELLWTKLYVIQRDRCDWPDVLNLIYSRGETMDWEHLLNRLGEDAALLAGVLTFFVWLCPGRARTLPDWLWERLNLIKPSLSASAEEINDRHVGLIDSRPWFTPAPTPEPAH